MPQLTFNNPSHPRRSLPKAIFHIVVLTLGGLSPGVNSSEGQQTAEIPQISKTANSFECNGSTLVTIVLPDSYKGEEFRNLTLYTVSGQTLVFSSQLNTTSDSAEFCMSDDLLIDSSLIAVYGYDECLGYKYKFVTNGVAQTPDGPMTYNKTGLAQSGNCRN